MLGLGLALTNFGSKGGISDVADGGLLSSTFLSTYGPYGMAMDFTDASIAIDDSTGVLDYNSQGTVSATTGALLGPGSKLVYSAPSLKFTEQSDGYIAGQAHNLCLQSENMQATWYSPESTITATSASTIRETSATNIHRWVQSSLTTLSGGTYQFSIEIRADGRSLLGIYTSGTNKHLGVDLSAGTIGSISSGFGTFDSSGTITPVGDSWYRLTLDGAGITAINIYMFTAWTAGGAATFNYAGNANLGLKIRKAHLRRTPSVSTYVATTSASVFDLPYVYSSGVKTGILVEPAATNLCLYSRDLTNAAWIKTSASAALTATGVDSVVNSASTLTASAANGVALQSITSASAVRSTAVYVKRRTGTGTVTLSHGVTTGSELITNGTFDTDATGWTAANATLSNTAGVESITNSTAATGNISQAIAGLTVGKLYKALMTNGALGTGSPGARLSVHNTASPSYNGAYGVADVTGPGTAGVCFRATATDCNVSIHVNSATSGRSINVDAVSLLEMSETDITSQINGSTWTRVNLGNETIAQPCVAFKLATSGDAIDVDICQSETGTVATSPVITYGAAVLRVGDDITLATSLVPSSATEGTIFAHAGFVSAASASTAVALFSVSNGTTTEMVYMRGFSNNPQALVHDSANNQTIDAGTWPGSGDVKMATAWAASDSAASLNGGAAVANGSSGTPTLTTFRVGGAHTASSQYGGLIKLVASFPVRKANATLEGMSTL